jgi:DNA-binding response OmpR family regulator
MEAFLLCHNSDESAILRLALQRVGFNVRSDSDLARYAANWHEFQSDLILLTFTRRELPMNIIRQVRAYSSAPLIVISDTLTEDAHVALLESGVDLVIFRPYSSRLLIAQIRSLLRRAAGDAIASLPVLTRGDLRLDPSEHTVQVGQQTPRRLTQLEFRLLFTLMNNAGRVLSAEELVERVWGYTGRGNKDMVRGLVKRLRAKVEPDPKDPHHILTIPGVGYKIEQ